MKIAFMTGGRGRHVSYFNITYIIEQRLLDGTISILLDLHLLAYVASYIAFAIWWFFFLVYDEKRKCLRYTRLFGEKFNIYFRHFYKTRISETVFTITKIEKFGFFFKLFSGEYCCSIDGIFGVLLCSSFLLCINDGMFRLKSFSYKDWENRAAIQFTENVILIKKVQPIFDRLGIPNWAAVKEVCLSSYMRKGKSM